MTSGENSQARVTYRLQDCQRGIRRAVIDGDDFEIAEILAEEAGKAARKQALAVIDRKNEAEKHVGGTYPPRRAAANGGSYAFCAAGSSGRPNSF